MCEDVLEGNERLSERVEFIHGGVDIVETWTAVWNLLTIGDGEEEPVIDLKRLPVRGSHRLQREDINSEMNGHNPILGQLAQINTMINQILT